MRALVLLAALPFALAGCGGATSGQTERLLDARNLVAQLSDLPDGYDLVPAESFSVPLDRVLADPWATGSRALIRRERLSGYQAGFTTPSGRRLECSAAVYRSRAGATSIFSSRNRRFAAWVAARGGPAARAEKIGDMARAFRYSVPRADGYTVVWRFHEVLSSCASMGSDPPEAGEILRAARGQQARIARAVGG